MIASNNVNKIITLFVSSLQCGGTEKVCVTLANGFVKHGFDVELLVLNLQQAKYRCDLDSRVKLINFDKIHVRKSLISVARYLLRNRPSTILVFSHQLAVLLVILRRLLFLDIRVIARNGNTLSQKFVHAKSSWHKYIVKFFVSFFYHHADHIIAQSYGMSDDLISNFGIKQSQISVINNPSTLSVENLEFQPSISSQKGVQEILCVGGLSQRKANHFLIEAFSRCLKHKQNLILRFVGEGPTEQALKAKVNDLGISNKVFFEGFVNDMVDYYQNADLTVLTSLCEGFPNVLVESISLGTPVVSFDCPSGPREIIINGLNGYLARYLDVNDLTEKIIDALDHKWDHKKIIDSASRYDYNHIIEKYLKLIENITVENR